MRADVLCRASDSECLPVAMLTMVQKSDAHAAYLYCAAGGARQRRRTLPLPLGHNA